MDPRKFNPHYSKMMAEMDLPLTEEDIEEVRERTQGLERFLKKQLEERRNGN